MSLQQASGASLAAFLAAVDAEFIGGRGRSGSLATRYPAAFPPHGQVWLMQDGSELRAGLCVRRFEWPRPEGCWRGAMIGMVWTAPAWRGQGLGAELMRRADADLQAGACDFAVLWTGQPAFYEKLGWLPADCGLWGRADAPVLPVSPPPDVSGHPVTEADAATWQLPGEQPPVLSGLLRGRTCPLPATGVERWWAEAGADALIGVTDAGRILYEWQGSDAGRARLWHALQARPGSLSVNERAGSPGQTWLDTHARLTWQPQRLALWRSYTSRLSLADFSQWYVHYLDRI